MLSSKEALILRLLCDRGEMYGLQLVADSEGELRPGTVYVTLGRMEAKGYVSSREEERPPHVSGLPRRLYQPTARGLSALEVLERLSVLLKEAKVTP